MLRKIGLSGMWSALVVLLTGASDPHAGPAMNFHRVNDQLATGGHFVGDGLSKIAEQGVEVVVDLRPENPAKRRAAVKEAGLEYVHVPVSWRKPTLEQFDAFRDAMQRVGDRHVMVQCAANYRASAFTFLYQSVVNGVDEAEAREHMNAVWEPNDRWRKFMRSVRDDAATDR